MRNNIQTKVTNLLGTQIRTTTDKINFSVTFVKKSCI